MSKDFFEIAKRGKIILADTSKGRAVFLSEENVTPTIQATIGVLVEGNDGQIWEATTLGWKLDSPLKREST